MQDTLFHGRFSVNVPARILAYEKKICLPNGTNIAASAGFQHLGGGLDTPLRQRFRPILGAQLRFGSVGDGNMVYSGDGFSLKQRIPLPLHKFKLRYPRVELEVGALPLSKVLT